MSNNHPQIDLPTMHAASCPPYRAASSPAAGDTSAQCWYQRAHAAVQQRLSQAPQLLQEYGQLRALDADILLEHGCEVAEGPKAAGRNRYCDVLPFDFNRCVWAPCAGSNSCALSRV